MPAKVTIQDIADALGLSRNTVSKAINNTGILADSTRERILLKAQEMGYKQFSYMRLSEDDPLTLQWKKPMTQSKGIAVVFSGLLGASHFASSMIDRFQNGLSSLGYSMTLYRVLPEELVACRLPDALNLSNTAGIMCLEMFDPAYCRMLCGLDVPLLFVDSPVNIFEGTFDADVLLMDNQTCLFEFMREMKRRGKTRISYIGDIHPCRSFYERYSAFRQCAALIGFEDPCSIIDKDEPGRPYSCVIEKSFDVNKLPEVFICANDFIALDLMRVLEEKGLSVPGDVLICGFDDSPEARIVTPRRTTIHIHTQAMGRVALELLYSRILSPDMNYRTLYTETHLIYRESTGD